jgi:hypothetical protein
VFMRLQLCLQYQFCVIKMTQKPNFKYIFKHIHQLSFLVGVGLLFSIVIGSIFSLRTVFWQSNQPANASLALFNTFQHGFSNDTTWQNDNNFGSAANAQLVAGPWVLNGWQSYHTTWLNKFKETNNLNKTPYIYLYIVAGQARTAWGLQDCNVGTPSLCQQGANYIRANSTLISTAYSATALNIANVWGTTRPILLHFEPDFWQYASGNQQQGGSLTFQEAQTAMNLWTRSVKDILPNAQLVMDISPWSNNLASWSSGFNNFDYAGLVGKRFDPYGDGSIANGIDGKTYAQMSQMTGKKIIVNDTHGPGGVYMSYNNNWGIRSAVTDRWNDGVVAVLLPPTDIPTLTATIDNFQTNPVPSSGNLVSNLLVSPKFLLQGAFDTTTNTNSITYNKMKPNVSISVNQPYNGGSWNYNGTENINNVSNQIKANFVDWVLVELRQDIDNNPTTSSTLLARRALILQSDGSLWDPSTSSLGINFSASDLGVVNGFGNASNYFLRFSHRNHLSISNNTGLNLVVGNNNPVDFSGNTNVAGSNQVSLRSGSGLYGLKTGDVNASGTINAADRTILRSTPDSFGSSNYDLNLDGRLNSTDRAIIRLTPDTIGILR